MKQFYTLKGKRNKKCSMVECPFCLYTNRVYNKFDSSVIIKQELI